MTTDDPTIVDAWPDLDSEAVGRLLQMSSGESSGERDAAGPSATIADYRRHSDTRVVLLARRGDDVLGIVGARMPHVGICEVLDLAVVPDARRTGVGRALVEAAAEALNALAVRADTEQTQAGFWAALGFALRPQPDSAKLRAERRCPPEPPGFFTSPQVRTTGERSLAVELPPPGNTLPLVPEALHDEPLPSWLLGWLLEADEIFLMLQDLVPHLFPPVTPAVRPESIRPAIGTLRGVAGADEDVDRLDASDAIPDLPPGVEIPVRLLEIIAMADRIASWIRAARRVRAWSDAHGAGEEPWIIPDVYRPPNLRRRL